MGKPSGVLVKAEQPALAGWWLISIPNRYRAVCESTRPGALQGAGRMSTPLLLDSAGAWRQSYASRSILPHQLGYPTAFVGSWVPLPMGQ